MNPRARRRRRVQAKAMRLAQSPVRQSVHLSQDVIQDNEADKEALTRSTARRRPRPYGNSKILGMLG